MVLSGVHLREDLSCVVVEALLLGSRVRGDGRVVRVRWLCQALQMADHHGSVVAWHGLVTV